MLLMGPLVEVAVPLLVVEEGLVEVVVPLLVVAEVVEVVGQTLSNIYLLYKRVAINSQVALDYIETLPTPKLPWII